MTIVAMHHAELYFNTISPVINRITADYLNHTELQ